MFTCQAVLAGRWASAPQRWPCRGWSHKLRRCSPPWGSRGRGACGAACLARSVAGSFGPADATQDVMSAPQRRKREFAGAEFKVNVYLRTGETLPRQSWLESPCPVSSDSVFCTSWWRSTPESNDSVLIYLLHKLKVYFLFWGELKKNTSVAKTRK